MNKIIWIFIYLLMINHIARADMLAEDWKVVFHG